MTCRVCGCGERASVPTSTENRSKVSDETFSLGDKTQTEKSANVNRFNFEYKKQEEEIRSITQKSC